MKTCKICKTTRELSEYNKYKNSPDGHHYYCRECSKIKCKEWHRNNKEHKAAYDTKHRVRRSASTLRWIAANRKRVANTYLKRSYGISLEDFEILLKKQNGVCKICTQSCSRHSRLSVDHCHSTGVIRGLLCDRCNTGIGKFEDNPELLRKAAEYLEVKQ